MEVYEQQRKPSPSRAGEFVKGFGEGALNSALVTGLYNATAFVAELMIPGIHLMMSLAYLPVLAIALGAFSGIMAVRRSMQEDKETAKVSRDLRKEIETLGASRGIEQSLDASELEAANDELAPSARWSDRFARQQRASLRIQNILEKRETEAEKAASHVEALREERDRAAFLNTDAQR